MSSPLQVKRRIRQAQRTSQGTNTALATDKGALAKPGGGRVGGGGGIGGGGIGGGSIGGGGGGGGAVVKVRGLDNISLQLAKNAAHKQRGPGRWQEDR